MSAADPLPPRTGPGIGIDVQAARGCPYAVLDASAELVATGWLDGASPSLERELAALAARHPGAAFGIDAPRRPLPAPRAWYWRKAGSGQGGWRARRPAERGAGRHCEIVVKAHGIANPQWTPLERDAPEWMRIGFRIFRRLTRGDCPVRAVHEVFPSASRALWPADTGVRGRIEFEAFRPGPKDLLDAIAAALTVFEFEAGRGCEVGGGDGYGTIVLPRPLADPIAAVQAWPGDAQSSQSPSDDARASIRG